MVYSLKLLVASCCHHSSQSQTTIRSKAIKTQTLMYAMQNILIISQHVQPRRCAYKPRATLYVYAMPVPMPCHAIPLPRHTTPNQSTEPSRAAQRQVCQTNTNTPLPPQTPTPHRPNPPNTKKQPRTVYPPTHPTQNVQVQVKGIHRKMSHNNGTGICEIRHSPPPSL